MTTFSLSSLLVPSLLASSLPLATAMSSQRVTTSVDAGEGCPHRHTHTHTTHTTVAASTHGVAEASEQIVCVCKSVCGKLMCAERQSDASASVPLSSVYFENKVEKPRHTIGYGGRERQTDGGG